MAPDKKVNKRKAAVVGASDSPAKKTKKGESQTNGAPKASPKAAPKDAPKAAPKPALKANKKNDGAAKETKSDSKPKANGEQQQSKRQIKPRKRAADFLSDDEGSDAEAEANPTETKAEPEKKGSSNKKSKKEEKSAFATKEVPSKAEQASAKPKAKKEPVVEESKDDEDDDISFSDSDDDAAEDAAEDAPEDDQTVALIRGFESSGDEDDASGDEGFDPKNPVPNIPDSKKSKRKILKKQKKATDEGPGETTGTVYVGRIPHGFYEYQMRAYFSQFGDITRLRLSRNRITGRSKHYAFIEFSSAAVAKIVAETMDNYLMYGHILKCKYIPSEQLHPEIWKGANRRFKRTPWNRIEKKRLDKGKTREQWSENIAREQKRRIAKAEKLKAVGYEFELPQLMSIDEVPVTVPAPAQEETKAVEDTKAAEEPAQAIEAPETEVKKNDDTPKKTKSKKEKKATQSAAEKETPKKDVEDVKKDESKVEKKAAGEQPATKAGKAKKPEKKKAKAKA